MTDIAPDLAAGDLADRRPRPIVCEISGYGTGGPCDARRAYDLLVQSEAAVVSVPEPANDPIKELEEAGIACAELNSVAELGFDDGATMIQEEKR